MKKKAYLILAHQYPEQLARLIRRLDTPQSIIFIHLDVKSDIDLFKKIINQYTYQGEVTFIANRIHIIRFGFNMIKATLEGLKAVLQSGHDFSHVTLMSGQDYPLKSIESFHQYLEEISGKSLISHSKLPFEYWNGNGGLDRVHYYHIISPKFHLIYPLLPYIQARLDRRSPIGIWKIVHQFFKFIPPLNQQPRKFLPNLIPYGGSQWWTLSAAAAHYAIEYIEKNPSFYNFYRYTHIPDEMFFHTLILNSTDEQIRTNVINRNFRYIVFDQGASEPHIFTIENLQELLESGRFFARKFNINVDKEILDRLDQINESLMNNSINES